MPRFHRHPSGGAHSKRPHRAFTTAITALVLTWPLSCRSKAVSSTSSGPATRAAIDLRADPGTVYQVTFGDSTVLLDQATVRRTLRSVSTNGNVFVFDSTPEIARLVPGSVLVIRGAAMLRVLAVVPSKGEIALITLPAALTDAIRNAHIHFNHDIHFGVQQASADATGSVRYAAMLPDGRAWRDPWSVLTLGESPSDPGAPAGGAGTISTCGTEQGWKYCVSGGLGTSQLTLHLEVKRKEAGYSAIVTADGHLDDFNIGSDIDISGYDLQQFAWTTNKLVGLMNVSWEAGKDSPGVWSEEDKIPLPTSFELPLMLADIPLTLEVSEALIIHPGFTGNGELSTGHFRIQWDGSQSFTLHNGNLDDHGNVTGSTEIIETRGISPLGPHAFLTALDAPRIELKFEAKSVMKGITQYLPTQHADQLASIFSQTEAGQQMLHSPMTHAIATALSLAKSAVDTVLKSNAAAHIDFILTASLVESGSSAIVPCKQAIGSLTVKIGADATVFGQSVGKVDKEVFQHGVKSGTTQGICNTDGAAPGSAPSGQ
jgi:hypothetical protein